mmetsp:Transcript_12320/g.34914  ORF Transcript_12320/g.34914 Transcript_12320/m.34914 type:complete len:309 (-) Transcript_12320:458-1384(-)
MGRVVERNLPYRGKGRKPHPRVLVRETLRDEVDALVNPGGLLDVLHYLRDRHDGGARVLPVRCRRQARCPDELEEHGHEDVVVVLLREAVEVLLAVLHDVVVAVVVVVLLALGRPGLHVLLDLQHPLDVEAQEPLQLRLALGLGEVVHEAAGQRHGRLHGAVPDGRVREGLRPGGAEVHERGPELGQAVVPEELGLLVGGGDQGLQRVLERLLLPPRREALQRQDHLRHDAGQGLHLLRVEVLDELQHELCGRRADLSLRVGEVRGQHGDHLLSLGQQPLAKSAHEVLQDLQRHDFVRTAAAAANETR